MKTVTIIATAILCFMAGSMYEHRQSDTDKSTCLMTKQEFAQLTVAVQKLPVRRPN